MADSIEQVRKIKSFLLSQFAAECYLDDLDSHDDSGRSYDTFKAMDIDTENDYDKSDTLTGRLALGANHYDLYAINEDGSIKQGEVWSATRATKVMIDDLAREWEIVNHISILLKWFCLKNTLNYRYSGLSPDFNRLNFKEAAVVF